MTYERATRFGRSGVTVPAMINNATPKRDLAAQKRRKFLRDYRLRRLDELMERHKYDLDYGSAMSAWRREKCDLLMEKLD